MLSRVADSIYWMSRYIERAENVARFIDVNLHLMLDLAVGSTQQWQPLVDTTGDSRAFKKRYGVANQQNVIHFLTFDAANPNSIVACVRSARENARSVREVISSEMWLQVNRFYLQVRRAAFSDSTLSLAPHDFFQQVKLAGHTFEGVMDATMSHGEPWHFGRIGRFLERADKTTRILDMKYFILLPDVTYVGSPYVNIQWAALLRSASALEMYRKKYGRIVPRTVVEFLLLDPKFPRSVRYCLSKAERSLHAITGAALGSWTNGAERELGRLNAELSYADTGEILTRGLHEYIDGLQQRLNYVGQSVFETFFAMKPVEPEELGDRPSLAPLPTTRL